MTEILKTQIVLSASTADAVGQSVEISNCHKLSITVRASVTAATLSAAVSIGGTNTDALGLTPGAALPPMVNGVVITAAPAEIVYSTSTGLLTFTNPAIGTHEVTLAFAEFPKWVRPAYDYTSGGGTVDVQVILSAWSA